ncbi:YeiH family protein [Paenibacillus lignilyticus]|uniref:Sulfate exporter family transporter n=1 Tax=Paenibacillus lignilyticus TaxID=1172615 RepID=A0ABS5CIS5_9BACL|nr:putative sulfate exporter family transporter [Paenibacillus lignilyticus]MBP3965763.1 putative sulfate exporter family transporter [Paenibacillus lignilyticus]
MKLEQTIKPIGPYIASLGSAGSKKAGGIGFTFLLAAAGYGLSQLPVLHYVGQMACAILLAVIYRQVWGYPEALRAGITFSGKSLLRLAIILYGIKLNLLQVFQDGPSLLIRDIAAALFAIGCTLLLAKLLKADQKLSLLLGIGTAICGAAAIAAVSPILRSKEEDTAVSVGLIALVGTVFAVGYTMLRPVLALTELQYGIWSGTSLHEIAHVALAAAPAGEDALAGALLAKLGRVFLLVPLSLVLILVQRQRQQRRLRRLMEQTSGAEDKAKIPQAAKLQLPWFLLGFLALSALGSTDAGQTFMHEAPEIMNAITKITTFLLTMAMVALGLNVDLRGSGKAIIKPLAAMVIASVLLAVGTYFTI